MNMLSTLKPTTKLRPSNAVAAIIYTKDNEVLLQKRDNLSTIFYPNYWGFFGGAIDYKESSNMAIRRELLEEINYDFPNTRIKNLGSFSFNAIEIGISDFTRDFYTILISKEEVAMYKLGEGADFALYKMSYALENIKIVPYDAFMLWMFCYKKYL
jgi:8-oxo-dGTP pyrophosphatase MutT (NUDIX family)